MSDLNGLINWQQLQDLSGGDTEFEQELLQMYVQDAIKQLQRLGEAVAAEDFTQVYELAHYLKGASANVGAQGISAAAASLEMQAKHQRADAIATAFTPLQQQLQRLHELMA